MTGVAIAVVRAALNSHPCGNLIMRLGERLLTGDSVDGSRTIIGL
jgi:hypothetical protein